MAFQQGNNMHGNAAMSVFLSDAIANGRLGQTLLYIKDFRKANQLFRIISKLDSCDKLFLFFKISHGKVANYRQQISAALLITKRRDMAIDVLIARKGGKVVHIFFPQDTNHQKIILQSGKLVK